MLLQRPPQARENPPGQVVAPREDFVDLKNPAFFVEQDDVGERSAHVHTDAGAQFFAPPAYPGYRRAVFSGVTYPARRSPLMASGSR